MVSSVRVQLVTDADKGELGPNKLAEGGDGGLRGYGTSRIGEEEDSGIATEVCYVKSRIRNI